MPAKNSPTLRQRGEIRSRLRWYGAFLWMLFFLLGVISGIFVLFVAWVTAFSKFPNIAEQTIPLVLIGLLLSLSFAPFLFLNLRRLLSRDEVVISPEGIRHRKGKIERFWRWPEIDFLQIRQQLANEPRTATNNHALLLYVNETYVLRFHNQYQRYPYFVEAIQDYWLEANYLEIRAKLNHGYSLMYLPLFLDNFGLRYGGMSYPWKMMKSVHCLDNELIIIDKLEKILLRLSIYEMSNSHLVYHLVREQLTGELPKNVLTVQQHDSAAS